MDQPFFLIFKISPKRRKKEKKKRERKGMKCFLMVGFQFTKVLIKKNKNGKDGHISIFNFHQKATNTQG